jgi:Zn-dependent alcohol dehydrogenase
MQQVRAVVARDTGASVDVATVNVPDPAGGEAVVQVRACGVCHTDLHYREGGINDEFTFLLDLYQKGRLDLDGFVTQAIGLDDVEAAFETMHRGDVLRSVVVL